MRCWTLVCVGLVVCGTWSASEVTAQTELFRFPQTQGVSVFRSTDPVPAVASPVAVYPPATTSYRVVVPASPAAPIVSYAPVVQPPVTTTYYPAAVTDTWTPVEAPPAEFATQWTPVDATTTSYSPVTPGVPADAFSQAPMVIADDSTSRAQPYVTYSSPTNWTNPNYTTVLRQNVPANTNPAAVTTGTVVTSPTGQQVIVRPKVYIQGQPVRNLFRAITP